MNIEIPKTKTYQLTDSQRFAEGLKLLAEECNLKEVTFNALGVKHYTFEDGSYVGCLKMHENAGLIHLNKLDE